MPDFPVTPNACARTRVGQWRCLAISVLSVLQDWDRCGRERSKTVRSERTVLGWDRCGRERSLRFRGL